jgi:hypothetical protein
VLLVALVIGFQRGVIQPLLVEVFFLGALLLVLRNRQAFTAAVEKDLHANAIFVVFLALLVAVVAGYVGGVLGAAIHRMPVVRGVDGFLGVFAHVAVAAVAAYVLLSALVTMDKAFTPVLQVTSLNAAQVRGLETALHSNALASAFVDSRELERLQSEAASPGGARIATVSQLDQLARSYEDFVRPQLEGSRLARVILGFGSHLPFLGHVGPADLPVAAPRGPAPQAKPSPRG